MRRRAKRPKFYAYGGSPTRRRTERAIDSLRLTHQTLSSASASVFSDHRLIELRHVLWADPFHCRNSIASSVSLRKVGASSHEPAFPKTPVAIRSSAGTWE